MGTEGFRFSILMKTLLAVFFKILCIYLRERVHAHAHEQGGQRGAEGEGQADSALSMDLIPGP